jgi:hypothetical protein
MGARRESFSPRLEASQALDINSAAVALRNHMSWAAL